MRKHLLILALICWALALFTTSAMAASPDTWHTANSKEVAWDAVLTDVEGAAIEYAVYAIAPNADRTAPPELLRTAATQTPITLPVQGKYIIGVRTLIVVDGEQVEQSESISWSDDPLAVSAGGTFGLRYFNPPGRAVGLRSQ